MPSFKNFVKYSIKRIISLLLHVFWIFPVKKNKIILINDHSYTFSDNLKYLSYYLLDKDPKKYNIYYSLKNVNEINDKRINPIKFNSLTHFFHAITSDILITNNSGIVYLPIRKKQLVINTWHGGGPYKVTGDSVFNNFWYELDMRYNAKKVDYILSSCRVFSEVEAKGMRYKRRQCINCGTPRLDFFYDNKIVNERRNKIYKEFNLSEDTRIVLYAPTFRGAFEDYSGVIVDDILEIDYANVVKSLEESFGGKWVFAVRLHPRLKDVVFNNEEIINMTFYSDPQELLAASDALITDYSSIIWDYSLLKRPCFVFATDINDYEVKRGFYMPPEKWPYPIASSNEEMINNIKNYSLEDYLSRLEKHYEESGSYEKGHACKTVKKIIDKHINEA